MVADASRLQPAWWRAAKSANDHAGLNKADLDRELKQLGDRHPRLKDDDLFVAWFVRALSTEKESTAVEALTGPSGEKNLDAVLIDEDNDLVTLVQGKYRHAIMKSSEKPEQVMDFAQRAHDLAADDAGFKAFLKDLEPLATRKMKRARRLLLEKD